MMRRIALCMLVLAGSVVGAAVHAPDAGAAAAHPKFEMVSYPTGQRLGFLSEYFWLPDGGLVTGGWDGRVTYVPPGGKPVKIGQVPDVRAIGNHGMLGFAAANDYATTGTVYITYAKGVPQIDVPGVGMVEKWVASPPKAPTSFTYVSTLIDGATTSPPLVEAAWTHGLDAVVVAPDNTLFISVGDNSRNNGDPATLRAQDLDQPYGKLLHITTAGDGVPTNPFFQADAASSWRSRVYAYGFRNPFRFALDPRHGPIHVGDVGWRKVEEVDTIRSGDNAGWPCYEGTRKPPFVADEPVCQELYTNGTPRMPIVTYRHNGTSASVVGGMFYTGASYPRAYLNAFFYGDYVRGTIWTLRTDRHGNLLRGPEKPPFASGVGGPVDFRPGPNGDVTFAVVFTRRVVRIMTAIDARFAALAHPWRLLGAPTGRAVTVAGGLVRRYLHGAIYWSAATGAHEVHGPILDKYRTRGGPHSCLGFPTSDVARVPGGLRSRFTGGSITYDRASGRARVSC
jgi:glucose/arabinose dehydrogenase